MYGCTTACTEAGVWRTVIPWRRLESNATVHKQPACSDGFNASVIQLHLLVYVMVCANLCVQLL